MISKEQYFAEMKRISRIVDDYVLDFTDRAINSLFTDISMDYIGRGQKMREIIKYEIRERFNHKPKIRSYFGYLVHGMIAEKEEDYDPKEILPVLGSLELYGLSTYTLDDILDDQPVRAGRSSTYGKFGTNDALIAGILQRDIAFEMLKELETDEKTKIKIYEAFEEMDKMLYFGQLLNEHMKEGTTFEEYMKIRKLITSDPQYFSSILAYISKQNPKKISKFARILFSGFMIGNDFLSFIPEDIKHSTAQSGKSFEDIRKGLWTYPFIHYFSLERPEEERKYVKSILGNSEADDEEIMGVIKILVETGGLKECLKFVNETREKAVSFLREKFEKNPYRDRLEALVTYWMDLGRRYLFLKIRSGLPLTKRELKRLPSDLRRKLKKQSK